MKDQKETKSMALAARKLEDDPTKQLQEYQKQGFNIVLPSTTVQKVSEFHDVSYEVVKLSIKDDAYAQDSWKDNPNEFSLNKVGLLKLSHAAGLVWDPVRTRRVDPATNRDYVAFQAVGGIQKQDGKWITFSASADMDMEVEEAELADIYTASLAKDIRDGARADAKQWQKDRTKWTEEQQESWISGKVKKELLRRRKYKVPITETKAMLRVVRGLLAIKSVFARAELEKPFVVPHIVFSPDMSDPDIRRAVMDAGLKGIAQAYGSDVIDPGQRPIEIHHHHEDEDREIIDLPENGNGGNGEKTEQASDKPDKPAEAEKSDNFFQVPATDMITVKSLGEFKALPVDQRERALKALMIEKRYPEALLTNPDIKSWPASMQENFCKMLLDRKTEG